MPSPVRQPMTSPSPRPAAGTVRVRPGDTLAAIAQRALGSAGRWGEIYALNQALIGADPARIRPGTVLRLPGAAAASPATVASPPADTDRDGVIDRYDAAPGDARDKRWNQAAADAYAAFVPAHTEKMARAGAEIDCADFSAKLMADFCQAVGLPNPLAGVGKWHTYSPEAPGGLPNVKGPTYFNAGLSADKLAKQHSRVVTDADGDGVVGWDRATGRVDAGDLRAGDMLFYDWNGDGKVDHTINVVDVAADGTVSIAYGTYNNLGDKPLTWDNLDIQPLQRLKLKPGTEAHDKWLGAPGQALWGVRRFSPFTEAASAPAPAPVRPDPVKAPETPSAPKTGWLRRLGEWLGLVPRRVQTPQDVQAAKA